MIKLTNLLAIAALVAIVGCASFETNAYRGIATTHTLVDGAMNGWGDWVRAGKATEQDEIAVRSLFDAYQSAMFMAEAAVEQFRTTGDEEEVNRAVAVMNKVSAQLVNAITERTNE